MASRLAWLDHSESQQRRMMEVVGLFRERKTIDDLGLGSIRDTFSDALFPGTSTLHTRTKYLLFVPWIFKGLEQRNAKSSQDVAGLLREREVRLGRALQAGGETNGVIGRDAGAALKQFPSATYWGALGRYGIRTTPATRQQIINRISRTRPRRRERHALRNEAEEYTELHDWNLNVPSPEPDFLEHAEFALDEEQGAYLADRIQQTNADSFLAFLILNRIEPGAADHPWDVAERTDAAESVRATVDAAEAFSDLMHGAQLLYHFAVAGQLAATIGPAAERVDVDAYRDAYLHWASERLARGPDALSDRIGFWTTVLRANPSIGARTREFVEAWLDLVESGDPRRLADSTNALALITQRERVMKGPLARLTNLARLDTFGAGPEASPLSFRWDSARTVLDDLAAARSSTDA